MKGNVGNVGNEGNVGNVGNARKWMTSKEMDGMQSATSAFVTASQSGRFRFFFPSFETVQYVPANFRAQADVTMLMDVSATVTPPLNALKMIVNVPGVVGTNPV
jgi:hypothetical protein